MVSSFRFSRLMALALVATLLVALVPALPKAQAAGGVMAYGDTVSGQINSKTYFELWQFDGNKGDRVRITMTGSGGLDPYLGLIDGATEQVLAEDDDSAGNSNALIDMTLPVSGSFVIVATRYDFDQGTSQGQYSLELVGNNSPTSNPAAPAEPQELEPGVFFMGAMTVGEPMTGEISADSYAQIYSVELEAGTEIVAGMFAGEGSAVDAYLIFATQDGDVLAEDDDSGAEVFDNKTDALVSLTVKQAGTYLVVATRAGLDAGKSTGAYTLFVGVPESEEPQEPVSNELPPGMVYMGDIAAGGTASGTVTNDAYMHIFTLEGTAGDEVTITATGTGGLDAYLGLIDPNDEVIAEDDDSAGGTDAQIAITLPESGTYLIVVTRNGIDQGTSTGDYTLTVTAGTPAPPAGQTGVGGFGGLPGRAFAIDGGGAFYLRGFGKTDDPAKASPVQGFLNSQALPGRGAGLRTLPKIGLGM
jgi:hypothetical protein